MIEIPNPAWNFKDGMQEFADDVLAGLSAFPKKISSKYFYDARGSELFRAITRLEEYYPTACEEEIFKSYRREISRLMPEEYFNLIELGAGDGRKTRLLIEQFLQDGHRFEYLPVDISHSAIQELDNAFGDIFPGLRRTGIVADYRLGLDWIVRRKPGRNVVVFLGSNIGNFPEAEASFFLSSLAESLNEGDRLLIGFDLKKDIETMRRAYNDSCGVTSEFNLNLLRRMNEELGANFDLSAFRHYGTYNPSIGAMESYLISQIAQTVTIGALNRTFSFAAHEPLHLEYSNKFSIEEVEAHAEKAGFRVVRHYLDSRKYFLSSLWIVYRGNLSSFGGNVR